MSFPEGPAEDIQLKTLSKRAAVPSDTPPPPLPVKPRFVNNNHNNVDPRLSANNSEVAYYRSLSTSTDLIHKPLPSENSGITETGITVPLMPKLVVDDHSADENDETDDELVHTFNGILKNVQVVMPTKSQVLLYFGGAISFKLRRIGADLQVTDGTDYPLFDVWVEMDCCRCTWVIESYGKVVLLMHEQPANLCCGSRRPPITISDWNGDVFGYLVPGDPFLLQSPDKQTIAKLVPHAMSESTSSASVQSAKAPPPAEKQLCWLCVLEGSGRHIVRLEGFDSIQYNKDVAFQLKLLSLAGIIRLSAPWNMPRRGDTRHAMSGIWGAISTVLNFCAYCLY